MAEVISPHNKYSWEDYLTYGASETKTIVFDPRGCSCGQIIFEPLIFSANGGPIIIDILSEVSYTADTGTLLESSNRNETANIQSGVVLRLNPSGFSGTKFAGDLIPATGVSAPTGAGNINPPGVEFEIDITKVKAVQLTNNNGDGVYVLHKFTWEEV
jgi:hypothetical protein